MTQAWLDQLKTQRAIAVLRTQDLAIGRNLAHAVVAGGMRLVEITWNSVEPDRLIAELRETFPDCWIGTGTVLTVADLKAAIACGCQFCFTPHLNPPLIETAVKAGIPIIPGALTPTEIVTAWQAGASAVKVFPVQAVGGVDYIKALQGPLGTIPLIPTGGVTLENAKAFIQAGAIAVGLSGQLFPPQLVQTADWSGIQQRVAALYQQLHA
ncbi:MAG: bifunctional 4-hydroxy-2-oxoglutarate aldolase/2-dehydro-3-deoxy-phosphogluconate aldolase [Snowella sp.]|nr:bifunctional 4-hydroxy-2-oxoglutarate aldolase/2-dehydro-3-deoxy-phosphogluconate aldolase [Snowella sp.]